MELALVAVEDVDVYRAGDAIDFAVGTKLPEDEFHIRTILSVACYPNVVVLFDVLSVLHVVTDEHLVDVENGTFACTLFYYLHELTDALHEYFVATNLFNLGIGGLYVEYGR